jgi:hypothetical protein
VGPQLTLKKPYKHCVCKAFLFVGNKIGKQSKSGSGAKSRHMFKMMEKVAKGEKSALALDSINTENET